MNTVDKECKKYGACEYSEKGFRINPKPNIPRLTDSVSNIDENTNDYSNHSVPRNLPKISEEVDGAQAWLTLACIFVVNATTLGTLKIYGLIFEEIVAQKYYTREEASWSISTATTIQNLAGLLTPILALRLSWRLIEIIQTSLFVAANLGAYISQSLTLDIFFLGIVQGLALSFRYNMNVVINNNYFSRFRATAMGISLAGSTCGVFFLKPIITYVLDNSERKFRRAYLALAIIMSLNFFLSFLIRKPKEPDELNNNGAITESTPYRNLRQNSSQAIESSFHYRLVGIVYALLKSPSLHCIWIMQTIYFYISRTYTMFLVDYGVDIGYDREKSRDLLNFWVYGELIGRFLLGAFIDSRVISLKWNITLVNLILAIAGFSLIIEPRYLDETSMGNYILFGCSVAFVAALSSLLNMLIVPLGQEYLGKEFVPWAFAFASVITSGFLIARPALIGYSRDYLKSYDLLVLVMHGSPLIFSILFIIFEPLIKRFGMVRIEPDNA